MRGQNVCFYGKIRKIIPKLSSILLLIWSSDIDDKVIIMVITRSMYTLKSTAVCVKDQFTKNL